MKLHSRCRALVCAVFAFVGGHAIAGAWFPAGPPQGSHAVSTHATKGGVAFIWSTGPTMGTWSTSDNGARWNHAPWKSRGRIWAAGDPPRLWADGPLTSTDLGRSWRSMYVGDDKTIVRGLNPANPDELLASSDNFSTLFRTVDGGHSWTPYAMPDQATDVVVDWTSRRMYAKVGPYIARKSIDDTGPWLQNGLDPVTIGAGRGVVLVRDANSMLLRSTNGGISFANVAMEMSPFGICDFAFPPPPSRRVYATDCDRRLLLRSEDDGVTWDSAASFDDPSWFFSLAVDAVDPDRLYVASESGVLGSINGGMSFAPLRRQSRAPGDPRLIGFDAVDPLHLWLFEGYASGPTLLLSTDGGTRWFAREPLELANLQVLGASRSRARTLYAMDWDLSEGNVFAVSTDAGLTWRPGIRRSPDGSEYAAAFTHGAAPGTLFVAIRVWNGSTYLNFVHASMDDGESFTRHAGPPIDILALGTSTSGPPRLYAGGYAPTLPARNQLWRSADAGTSWQFVAEFAAPWMPEGSGGHALTAIIVDPVDPDRIYLGFTGPDYVLRTTDGGATWVRANAGLGAGPVRSLAIDPTQPSTVYVAQEGSGVSRSADGGTTWRALDEGIDGDQAFQVVVDPHHPGRIYAVTESGLFRADLLDGIPTGLDRAIEYYHVAFDHFFLTADRQEIARLDDGTFAGWRRTHAGLRVTDADALGMNPVCRYFSVGFAPLSSHFYSPYPSECASLATNAAWLFEGTVFGLAMPDASGGCPPATRPLYRAWNRSMGGAPNHRYTTDDYLLYLMLQQNWQHEGNGNTLVFACVPV